MRNWRVVTAIAAVVLAAIASVLVWQYVDEADDRAKEDQEPVKILVAGQDIARGTSGQSAIQQDLFTTDEYPRDTVKGNWLRPSQQDEVNDLVASADIPAGLPIVLDQFVARGETEGFAGLVEEGQQAITISVDDSHGVAGFITPNDMINLILTTEVRDLASEGGDTVTLTAFLIPGVKVLAVGQTTELGTQTPETRTRDTNGDGEINQADEVDTQPQEAVRRGLLTLSVNPRQAEQIAAAQIEGTIYVSLNPDGFEPGDFTVPEEIVEAINLFDQPLPRVEEALRLLAQAAAQN